jgi:hypothetical protein
MTYDDDDTFSARMPDGRRVIVMGKGRLERFQRLRDLAKHIVNDPHAIDDDTKAKLKTATMKYASTLHDDPAEALKVLYHDQDGLGALVRKALEVIADHDALDRHERVAVVDHHASKVADLLVEAGSHPDRAAALDHLLHKPSGQALLARMSKAAEPAKDHPPMDSVHSIMKAGGIAATCAAIVAKGTTTISEHELVEAATKVAAERHPELTEAQAFSKIYTAGTEEARVLQNAIAIAKSMPFVADLTPLVVGTPAAMHEAVDDTEQSEALAQLKELGARKWPTASEAQQFANAFTDPANATLSQKAHRRPTPPMGGAYPFPR